MAVMFTWADLRELRLGGHKPTLRMFVTTNPNFARRMTWVGCAAIYHEAGEPMPVELLDGLDVILDVGQCQRAEAVKRLMTTRGATPSRLQVWCACDGELSVLPRECGVAVDQWLTPREVSHEAA